MAESAILRCDASPVIGAGHIMRCLTLASALSARGWTCKLLALPGTTALVTGPAIRECEIIENEQADDPAAARSLAPGGCGLMVLDSYRLGASYLRALSGWAARRLVLEDRPLRELPCEIVLDPTLDRAPEEYASFTGPATDLLLGPGYGLLRPQFADWRANALRHHTQARPLERILLALGGAPHLPLLRTLLDGIAQSRLAVEVHAVGNGTLELPAAVGSARIVRHGATTAVHEVMAGCDLAIGAAGGMAWERCCLGLPTLMVELADNQSDIASRLSRAGAAIGLGRVENVTAAQVASALQALAADPARRQEMSRSAALICDGLGASRAAGALAPRLTPAGEAVTLRPVSITDAELMFAWQQIPEVRRFTPNQEPPAWSTHIAWLRRRLGNPAHGPFSIILHGRRPVGVLRLDAVAADSYGRAIEPGALVVSILIDPAWQGRGIARLALAAARDLLRRAPIYAEVLPGNEASHKLFRSAGYRELSQGLYFSGGHSD